MNLFYTDVIVNEKMIRIVKVPQYILDNEQQTEIYQAVLEEVHHARVQLMAEVNTLDKG